MIKPPLLSQGVSALGGVIKAHPAGAAAVTAGAIMLFLLQRNRDVHPTSIYSRRNEGHVRMDAGKYDHLYRGVR